MVFHWNCLGIAWNFVYALKRGRAKRCQALPSWDLFTNLKAPSLEIHGHLIYYCNIILKGKICIHDITVWCIDERKVKTRIKKSYRKVKFGVNCWKLWITCFVRCVAGMVTNEDGYIMVVAMATTRRDNLSHHYQNH